MDLIHIKITFEDTFSGAKDIKYCTRSVETFEKMKAGIGAIVNTFKDHINYSWEVIKVEQMKNNTPLTEIKYHSQWIALIDFTIGIGSNSRNPNTTDLPIPKGTILKWDGDAPNGNVWFIVNINSNEYRGKIESGSITNVINAGKIELKENGKGHIAYSGDYLQKLLKK